MHRLIAILVIASLTAGSARAQIPRPLAQSGHHYSWIEGARIGHDFGRNPWSPGGRSSVGFASIRGRSNLRAALQNAVAAGETAMSFDFGFDLRSVVLFEGNGTVRLDPFAVDAIEAFLEEIEVAHRRAQAEGRTFAADVVLTDFRIADGEDVENGNVIGEHPALFTSPTTRQKLFAAFSPAFARLGAHPLVTLNLMNEPEFLALPAARAIARIRRGQWGDASFVQKRPDGAGKIVAARGESVIPVLRSLGENAHIRVYSDRRTGAKKLVSTHLVEDQVDAFLLDLRTAVVAAAPRARITIGWADDLSAVENTRRLEQKAGAVVTDVISFHVYDVPENPWHPLTTTREDFAAVFGDRSIRITEWGLGSLKAHEQIRDAMLAAFAQVDAADLGGVLFWWDASHVFAHAAYGEAVATFRSTFPTSVLAHLHLPAVYSLHLNYPNPFNTRTIIRYSLESDAFATLRIYDAAGQLVCILSEHWQPAGSHQAIWDGRDEDGRRVGNGVYLYELRVDGESLQRKMVLLR